ncbi:quinone-dependent dihydroorotate dehydrogenase [Nocardioides sp. GY 10113]|uniref:quinone-dependent dihydroorotate dehydrogenase n=1 Tax=Nocardioides sp. GY 10113 TaxID=2569761 RepID=UPI0010A840E6|nr:quinone-dependent dihydroorotate dehydrogenase [Nocardioides sp. GY 10113]TIC80378.1 quinone-dependent dihydroorotate dehydrogenase [Nocardioides sp. GY 10113]TIC82461.1 quinone-dependent dihydroorotate dehydrogenase [Nocardioides sp. GY 10113]
MSGAVYDALFRHGFVHVDPEKAHHLGFGAIRAAGPVLRRMTLPGAPVEALGLTFPNVLGLAAGFDKQGLAYAALAGLGFGHVEIGTVTALAQPGNPQPRMFRLPEDRAIVNRMGFNNDGAHAVSRRLAESRGPVGSGPVGTPGRPVLGINIGKSKVVPDEDQAAVEADYETSTRQLARFADYLVVNVSSPNTPGLRNLQSVEKLAPLLSHVRRVADESTADRRVPLLVKIAPDLADEDVLAVADMALALGLDGIIATNTTISREGLVSAPAAVAAIGAGGLSGAPVRERATDVLRLLRERVGPELTLIGVGGIATAADAAERLAAGATLLQAYTGFIYGGPAWPRRILHDLERTAR